MTDERERAAEGEASPGPYGHRRTRMTLRELLDELLEYTRELTRRSRTMTDAELEYAHQRMEWLADEVWREAIKPREFPGG